MKSKSKKKIMSHYQELHTYFLSLLLAYCPVFFEKLLKSGMGAGTVLGRFSFVQSWSEFHNGLCQEKLYIVISTVLFQVEMKQSSIHSINAYFKKSATIKKIQTCYSTFPFVQECPKPRFSFPCNKKQALVRRVPLPITQISDQNTKLKAAIFVPKSTSW